MDEDEDTRLIAEYPDYPEAVVPTQSSRTAELCWVNNKITLGSKPVQRGSPNMSVADEVNKENVCKHCNVEFANNDLLIKHLLDLISPVKKTAKRKTDKPKVPQECQLSKKNKVCDNILKSKHYSRDSEDQLQVEPSTSNNIQSVQQTPSTNDSASDSSISKKKLKVRFSLDSDKESKKVQNCGNSYECKQCNIYFENNLQLIQHSVKVHRIFKDTSMFMRLAIKEMEKKKPNKISVETKMAKASKKEKKNERKTTIIAEKTLSYLPEILRSLSMQNSKHCDTLCHTKEAMHLSNKKATVSQPAFKTNTRNKMRKVTAFKNHSQPHTSVKLTNSEKTELFMSRCGLHFISYKSLQKHGNICNGSCDTPKFNCIKCGYLFPSDALEIHQSKHHNENQINIFDVVVMSQKRNVLECKSCTQKFTYKKSYQLHVLKCRYKIKTQNLSNQKVLYKCSQCNIYYTSQAGLKLHFKNKHLIRYALKKCDKCKILLSNRSFEFHIQIHHELFECNLKDLTINSYESKNNKRAGQLLESEADSYVNKNDVSQILPDSVGSNIVHTDKTNENTISIINNLNKKITHQPTEILPYILYKCFKCGVHFPTNSAHKDHVSFRNCPDTKSNEIEKCPQCLLVFDTESFIEHIAYQHVNKFKTSKDFLIICNDSVDTKSLYTTGNGNRTASTEHVQNKKQKYNQYNKKERTHLRTPTGSNVKNFKVYEKKESVKLFAEAWFRDKCIEMSSFASVCLDSYSNFLYRCYKCTLNFLCLGRLQFLESECKGYSFEWVQCPVCCYSFSISSLTLHMYVHHAKMALKRENFVIKSPESYKNSLNKPATGHMSSKNLLSTKETQNMVEQDINQTKNDIPRNNSKAIDGIQKQVSVAKECIDLNAKPSDMIIDLDSSQKTKDKLFSGFKSSRDKIAWAIDSIEDLNKFNEKIPQKEYHKELIEIFKENETPNNKQILTTTSFNNDDCNIAEKDVSVEIDYILLALDGKSKVKTNDNSIEASNNNADTEKDIQTCQVFKDIDSLVDSLDKNSKVCKMQEINIVLYKCNICCIHFMTSKSLQTHSLNDIHNKDLGTKCNICHLIFHKNTITRHVTNHHEKMSIRPLNYTIKTNFRSDKIMKRQEVTSEYFKKNQVDENILKYASKMLALTRKQKSSLCKVLKSSFKKKTTAKKPSSLIQEQNPLLKKILNDSKKQQNVNYNFTTKDLCLQHYEPNNMDNLSDSKVSTLVETSDTQNFRDFDFSHSQNSDKDLDLAICPVSPLLICTNVAPNPYKRKFSVDSNITKYEKPTKAAKSRTKSQDQSYTNTLTSHNSESSKVLNININNGTCEKNEKVTKIVAENIKTTHEKTVFKIPPYIQHSGDNIMPVTAKESIDNNKKAKHDLMIHNTFKPNSNLLETCDKHSMGFPAIVQHLPITINKVVSFETIDIMDDTVEYLNKNTLANKSEIPLGEPTGAKISTSVDETRARDIFLKQSCQKFEIGSKSIKTHSPETIDSSCIQKTQTRQRTFITYEDSNFEIRASYKNCENASKSTYSKVDIEDAKKLEKFDRNNLGDPSEFPVIVATHTSTSTSKTYQSDCVDIIDITEETNFRNIVTTATESNKNFGTNHSETAKIAVDTNRTAIDGEQNIHSSTSIIGADLSSTSMVLPSAPNFNLFNFINEPLLKFLTLPFQQLRFNRNPIHTKPKLYKTRNKNQSVPRVPSIFDNMQSCPICRCSDRVMPIKRHLKVKRGYFSCCFCAKKSTESELINHVRICGSQITFNSYT